MDEVWLTLLGAVVNGVMLFLGIFLGSKLSAKALRTEIQKVVDESNTLKLLVKILGKVDSALSEDLESKASMFFEKATELLGSEEARLFFKRMNELLASFVKSSGEEVKIKLPPVPKADKDGQGSV